SVKSTCLFSKSSSLDFKSKYKSVYLYGSSSSKSTTKSISELSLKSSRVTEPKADNDFTLFNLQSLLISKICFSSNFMFIVLQFRSISFLLFYLNRIARKTQYSASHRRK